MVRTLVHAMHELMNQKLLLLALLLLPLVLGWASQTKAPETTEPFPMSVGTSWTYRGMVRWTHDINKVSEAKVVWKMEVRRLIRRGAYAGAVVRGFPGDLRLSQSPGAHTRPL